MKQDLQEIYTIFDYHFDRIEKSLIDLEKGYYQLDILYNDIEKEMDLAKMAVSQRGENRLLRKLYLFEERLTNSRLKRGYDSVFFQKFFELIKELRKNSATDLLNVYKKANIEKFTSEKFYSFLMVQNGDLHFLISCRHLHWQKKIIRKKLKSRKVKMQISSFAPPNIFYFYFLQGEKNLSSPTAQKTAVLVERENRNFFGFFCDDVKGKFFLEKELFHNNQEEQKFSQNQTQKYMVLKGERYFIL